MTNLNKYLTKLQEREFEDPTENPEIFKLDLYKKLLKHLDGLPEISNLRQSIQPTLYSLFIKKSMGDYKGRIDSRNTRATTHLGIDDFENDKKELKYKSNQVKK